MKQSKLFKVVSLIGISVLTMGLFVGCGNSATKTTDASTQTAEASPENSTEPTNSDNVIVMGTNAEFEPFEYRDGLDIVGFDVEIAKAVANKLGKELKIEDMAFDSLIMGLNNDKMDFIAAGMTATEERAQQVDFSDSYFKSKQVIIVKADNTAIASADDLVGKSVGVQLGTTGDLFVSGTEGVTVVQVKKGTQAVMDLQNGKVDAVVIDEEPAKKMIAGKTDVKILEVPFIEEEYAIAVKKGNTELLNTINETIEELKANGEYDKIYEQFFGKTE
ncbi:basic amino acid ABC transporter substrate-binding protein [Cellulosilyticum lentocellum]|uniref:ABC-type transporter, periplasmic subunit family 3 n=1 Tax=Cellulosilyticum lentocellum (strain ATCC 49066 / DSM 5427 / NCIMB 11756 / RHM5) TaxID=642492 RepID=F2JSC1_CELLD|nr:basic amino acid ABC transporter substrate-binding protein [Cellulosilyticum lentocellum]ADZ85159.1 ABC-type transporter, periplasmic subunit family 3 [Cellulosilyticum lentocellum DSM 5427]